MTGPLTMDIRDRLVRTVGDGGMMRRSAAKRLGVAASTVFKWVEQWQLTGEVSPRPQGGDRRSQHLEAHAEEILGLIEQTPDITLAEIAAHLDEAHGIRPA